jgi:hypothetical protein
MPHFSFYVTLYTERHGIFGKDIRHGKAWGMCENDMK